MIIKHNLSAMNANRQLTITGNEQAKSAEKLSTGYKINRSADDAAGLAISEKMRWQIRGLDKGASNIQDGMSLIDVADGALEEVHSILQRMNELAVQAANDTNTDVDRAAIQSEVDELAKEITRIGKDTTFNSMPILDDAFGLEETTDGKVTSLISCASADKGYLSEAVKAPDGKWHSAAKLDFSNVNSKNMFKLDGKGFSFSCTENCSEKFAFEFTTNKNTPSSATGLNVSGGTHKYVINISKCKNGNEILNTLFNYVKENPPYVNGNVSLKDGIQVGHANEIAKDGSTLILYGSAKHQTESEAANKYQTSHSKTSGEIDCSALTGETTEIPWNEFVIQCSSNTEDYQLVYTPKVNAERLKIDPLAVKSHSAAAQAIGKVLSAIETISGYRSELGASSNRLEASYKNAQNMEENVQKSESLIRDTDMAQEMVRYSLTNILSQAGNAVLTQNMQNPQRVIELLQ